MPRWGLKSIRRLNSPKLNHLHSPVHFKLLSFKPIVFNMFFKTLLTTAIVAFFAAQATAAPAAVTANEVNAVNVDVEARAAMIAHSAFDACNCPKNCLHKLGSRCRFYRDGHVISASKYIFNKSSP